MFIQRNMYTKHVNTIHSGTQIFTQLCKERLLHLYTQSIFLNINISNFHIFDKTSRIQKTNLKKS